MFSTDKIDATASFHLLCMFLVSLKVVAYAVVLIFMKRKWVKAPYNIVPELISHLKALYCFASTVSPGMGY